MDIDIKVWIMSSLVILLTGKQSQLSFLIYKCIYNLSLSNNINFDWIQFTKGVFVDILMNGRHKRLYLIYG